MKRARVECYNFDSLPGHVTVTGSGSASDYRLAVGRAIRTALGDEKVKGKRVRQFQCRVVISEVANETGTT